MYVTMYIHLTKSDIFSIHKPIYFKMFAENNPQNSYYVHPSICPSFHPRRTSFSAFCFQMLFINHFSNTKLIIKQHVNLLAVLNQSIYTVFVCSVRNIKYSSLKLVVHLMTFIGFINNSYL